MKYLLPLTLLVAAGCASTPTQHYTLDMRASATAAETRLAPRHFTVADALASGEIPVQTSPTQLEYYEGVQWAGSLEDLLSEKFEVELGHTVATDNARVVDGHLLSFEQVDAGDGTAQAHCKIELQVRDTGESRYAKPVHAKVYEASAPMAATTPDDLAQALSRCIEIIAAQLRADTAALP